MKKSFRKAIAVLLAVLMVVFSAPISSFAATQGRQWWVDESVDLSTVTEEPDYHGYNWDDPDFGPWGYNANTQVSIADGMDDLRDQYQPVIGVIVSNYGSSDYDNATDYANNANAMAAYYGSSKSNTYDTCNTAGTILNPADLKAGQRIAVTFELGGFDVINTGGIRGFFDREYVAVGYYQSAPTKRSYNTWKTPTASASITTPVPKTANAFYAEQMSAIANINPAESDSQASFAVSLTGAAYQAGTQANSNFLGTGIADRQSFFEFGGKYGVYLATFTMQVIKDCDLADVISFDTVNTYVEPYNRSTLVDADGVSSENDTLYKMSFNANDANTFAEIAGPVFANYSSGGSTPVTNTYTVTVQNPDGTTNTTISDVAEGTLLSALTLPDLATFTTTSGYTTTTYKWDTPLTTAVNSDITIKAIVDQQTTEQFTVTFKTADDRADIVETVDGGTLFGAVTAPSHSAQTQNNTTIYTWDGWDKAADFEIGADTVVNETATTATRYYTVTFVTADSRADIVNSSVEYDTDLASIAPAQSEPVVTAATTTTYKWDIADGAKVTANTTVNEVTDQVTTNIYTVTFVTADNRADIVVNDVEYGTQISTILPAQSEPVVTAYSTTTYKWDVANDATVEGNTTINEVVDQVTGATYTVSFYDINGDFVKDVEVAAGNTVANTDVPDNTADLVTAATTTTYKWSDIPAEITADTRIDEVVDSETTNTYTITFNNYDGSFNSSADVAYGATPTAPETRTATAQYTYAWPTLETVTGDATYTETRTVNTYTVVFKNVAGDTVKEMVDAEYGTAVTAPANTATASVDDTNHRVYSWPSFSATVVADATITETYVDEAHTWTDGDVITPATFDAPGEQAIHCDVCGADSTKTIDQLTGGISVTVEAATLGTTALDGVDATAGLTQKFAENARITLTATPDGSNTFVGWAVGKKIVSDAAEFTTTVNAAITYTPVFAEATAAEYSIVFVDSYGNILKNQVVTSPDKIEAPEVSDRLGYTFTGWEPANYNTLTESATVVAQFTKNAATTFTVTVPAGATIKVNGTAVDGTTADVVYDTMVTVSYDTATAWFVNGNTVAAGYGSEYTFYVGSDVDLTFTEAVVAKTPSVIGVQVTAPIDATAWKVTFLASRTIPDGFKLEKAGFVYGKDIDDDNLVLANVNGTTIRAMYMQNMNADQFELSTGVKAKTAGAKISARAFIIYSDGTGLHTVEANVLSYTY